MPTDINSIQAWCAIITALITLIASYFVVETFTLQAQVMLEQSKITKLEVERSIKEKRPLFKAERIIVPGETKMDTESYIIKFSLVRSDIYNFSSVITHYNKNPEQSFTFSEMPDVYDGIIEGTIINLKYKLKATLRYLLTELSNEDGHLDFFVIFTYKDILGNKYRQEVVVRYFDYPISKPPTIVK